MAKFVLEACVDSVESAIAASKGGADRLELCSNLIIGGTTPGLCLYKEVKKHTSIPVHILLRPRFGDFCYSEAEISIMKQEICAFKEAGADGMVLGVLKPDGTLNMEVMRELIACGDGMHITLHRAFDMCREPFEALEQAVELGVKTILTSGQQDSAVAGAELLGELVKRADGRLQIQAGAGIRAEVISPLFEKTGVQAYHMSGKITIESAMQYRNTQVFMGLPGISEYEIWRTDEARIREAANILKSLQEKY